MKALLWLLAVIALAVTLTLAVRHTAGFVLLVYPPYRIELSLSLLLLLLLAAFLVGYALLRLSLITLRLPATVRRFKQQQRRDKAHAALEEGLLAFFEGRYAKAEKAAATALELEELPALTAVVAARAAHELKAHDRRDHYLLEAERLAPDFPAVRLMTQAELLLEQRRHQEALAALKQLSAAGSKNPAALRLELKAQQMARNWDQALALVTQLEKRESIEPAQAELLKLNAHLENLKRKAHDAVALRDYWEKIPAADRLAGKMALAGALAFLQFGEGEKAQEIIVQSLSKRWDSELVQLFGTCTSAETLKQIERAEKWLPAHPDDAALLLALGRLCARQELWGKAQSYLEASLSLAPSNDAHVALAQLLEKIGRPDEACHHYRQGLELVLRGQ